jgi:hypothetical protein
MLLAHHLPFRLWRSYAALYDAVESRFTYEMIGKPSEETLADFLRRYDIARPHAVSHFKTIWDALALQVGRDYVIALVVAACVFRQDFLLFGLVFLTSQILSAFYIHFCKHHDLDLFAILMVQIILGKMQVSNDPPKAL